MTDASREARLTTGRVTHTWLSWIAQIGVAGVMAATVGRVLAHNWTQVGSLPVVLRPGWIALSTVLTFAAYGMQIESWRRMLAGWAQHLPEHVYDDKWLAILRSIRLALRPAGRLY